MRTFTSIRLVLAGVVLTALGIGTAVSFLFGDGTVHLVAPEDGLRYSVDGVPHEMQPGSHEPLKLKQGAHVFNFGGTTRAIKVTNGFSNLLVPVNDEQCFVVLDVSKSHFGSTAATTDPTLRRRIAADQIVDLSSSTYFSESSLPHSIKEGASCDLAVEVDCSLLARGDHALVAALLTKT